jgi:uncharacterized protein (TIGR02270 family)
MEVVSSWSCRRVASSAPNYSPSQFAELDERLEAHIDGLRLAGADGWVAAEAALTNEGPEDFFPATVLAIEAGDSRLDAVLDRARDLPQVAPGIISAFGWVEPKHLAGRVKALLDAREPFRQMLGIAACAVHRRDPGAALTRAVESPSPAVRARALRAAGELGRLELLPQVLRALSDEKKEARFFAARSGLLLGDRAAALDAVTAEGLKPGPRQLDALALSLRAMEPERAHEWLDQLPSTPDETRLRIIGTGMIGLIRDVPWLIEQLTSPPYARVAGEAFVFITGADVNLDQLEAMPPAGFEDGPTDDPADENVEVPEDIALPWLDGPRVTAWWERHRNRFETSTRYFLGHPAGRDACLTVLSTGFQRQRRAAALQRSLLEPGTPLFNTSAPAWRQQRWLAELT